MCDSASLAFQLFMYNVLKLTPKGVDPHVFDLVIHNTLAIVDPSSHSAATGKTSSLSLAIRQQREVTANMVALLKTVIGPLNARDKVTEGSKGIYDKTWQGIVNRFPA